MTSLEEVKELLRTDPMWVVFCNPADYVAVQVLLACDPTRIGCEPFLGRGKAYAVRKPDPDDLIHPYRRTLGFEQER